MLTIEEAARRLNVSKYAAYRLIHDGSLPAERPLAGPHKYLINEAAVEQLLKPRPAYTRCSLADFPPDALLTSAEAAAILRCGPETIRRMVNAGVLRAHRGPGRKSRIRITAEALTEYLNNPAA